MRGKFGLLLTILGIVSLPFASAVPSGLTYLDSTWSSLEGDGGELIAMNPNGTILASYHGKDIIFFDANHAHITVRIILQSFNNSEKVNKY